MAKRVAQASLTFYWNERAKCWDLLLSGPGGAVWGQRARASVPMDALTMSGLVTACVRELESQLPR